MEGIDLAGIVDSDFQGIQINFAPPRRICQILWGGAVRCGARLAFFVGRGGAALFPWGGAHIPEIRTLEVGQSLLLILELKYKTQERPFLDNLCPCTFAIYIF